MKILSWNLQQGGGSRIKNILQAIAELNAEVLLFSEFQNQNHRKYFEPLLRLGYSFQYRSAAADRKNTVYIASKIAGSSRIYDTSDYEYADCVMSLRLGVFDVWSVYMPHKKKHRLFDLMQGELPLYPSIVSGDYNTGINGVDQVGDSFWYEDDLKALESIRYRDAFREMHGSLREYSWYSHRGNGYRYDHTYLHEDLLPILKGCRYIHEWRNAGWSDHSPMLLELGA